MQEMEEIISLHETVVAYTQQKKTILRIPLTLPAWDGASRVGLGNRFRETSDTMENPLVSKVRCSYRARLSL